MNKRSLSDRRRAIYTGLKPFFDDASLMQAVTHWENRYADQPSLALQRYVADICQNPALKDKRASILRSLLHAMAQDSDELLADPRGPEAATSNTAETASASVTYGMLMLAMMGQVDESLQHKLRIELFAALRQRQLPLAILEALQNWLGTRQPLKLNNAPPALLQKLLNQYYVLLCENLGPVRADNILARGVAQVQHQHPDLDPFIDSLL
ncbi:hypothetical protein DOK_02636 [gamma proteobacterium BDW918]|uniref:Uncharacterized protein n=1 Tax=Zhongshania aliphaticivorans TaxID=1470434 RepID=A0A127M3P9_9GAMM|nr:hypothetical protein [Zhongshania aliphaticivorans]AMO67884.1 hypothetical protein AZF00_06020 [Zhongshania aliphaticivorans]EIF44702.1 hypothetical protein DOK_02636 [gamma proteobacterium BDW918]